MCISILLTWIYDGDYRLFLLDENNYILSIKVQSSKLKGTKSVWFNQICHPLLYNFTESTENNRVYDMSLL